MSCQFYGYNGMFGPLIRTGGNQCGLIVSSHSPCRLEFHGFPVEEDECPIAKAYHDGIRIEPDVEKGPFHRKIVAIEAIPNTRSGSWCVLECGHRVMTFGRLELSGGSVFCRECQEAAKRPKG